MSYQLRASAHDSEVWYRDTHQLELTRRAGWLAGCSGVYAVIDRVTSQGYDNQFGTHVLGTGNEIQTFWTFRVRFKTLR